MGRGIVTLRTASGRPKRRGAFASLLARLTCTLSLWRKRRRQRRAIDTFSDHMLKDMGLTRRDLD